ncbi:kelch-like protein 3 isoform X1 [Myzus persicae]|uniref:kelch-like protein 3 isoform X1 n=1 Tax=Myzus persicae TaxID=13164 RepID=UPI000B93951E|nr:kelch-like protein 3 isoform X1 [Myzus persicae]XP_022171366.1 kelch-like protein 3 isoform X1 [Myzus persicae]XP_022171367.1 kelch-like protein 3 isoform X1 [Myzus persicae]XP_022171368.1 kelch-like protein 3 isoform X1 [Myzus persicae]
MSDRKPTKTNFCAEKRLSLSYEALNNMRRNNKFCDVQFVVGDKNISAHKAILASHSKYFDSMFTGNFKDSTLLEIKNKEITPNSFEQLIDFLYTSQLTINDSNVQELLMASIFLILDDVKVECLKYVEQTIDAENFMTVKSFADTNNINDLHKLFLSYVLKNYKNIVVSDAFLSFSFKLMMELIQSDDLCAEEEEVYESTMLWLKHDLNERLKYLPELFKSIRLSVMSIDYLNNTVQEEDHIKSDIKCMSYLCHAYKEHLQVNSMDDESSLTNNITCRKYNQAKSKSLFIPGNANLPKPKDYAINQFLLIKDSPEFMSYTFEQLMELIKSDDLCAEEIQVYKAVMSWVKYDKQNRSELLPKLFLSIRLPCIQIEDLINIVENEILVSSNSKCMDFLHNTYKILALNRNGLMNTLKSTESTIFKYRNRHSKQVLLLYQQDKKQKIEWLDLTNKTSYETTLTWDVGDRSYYLILRDGSIFCMRTNLYIPSVDGSGRKVFFHTNISVTLYDGHLQAWMPISKPHFIHSTPSIVQFYDRIYVMSTVGVEYYDILKETWHKVKLKISITGCIKLTVVSDLIYGVCNSKAFCYNPKTDSAQLICSVNTRIEKLYSTCSLKDHLYIVGADDFEDHGSDLFVEKYRPQSNTWIKTFSYHTSQKNPGVIVMNDRIYLVGGDNNNSISYCNLITGKSGLLPGVSLKSTKHTNMQAFVIDTKISIEPMNILEYYSTDNI